VRDSQRGVSIYWGGCSYGIVVSHAKMIGPPKTKDPKAERWGSWGCSYTAVRCVCVVKLCTTHCIYVLAYQAVRYRMKMPAARVKVACMFACVYVCVISWGVWGGG
jgi:hypothetical protein